MPVKCFTFLYVILGYTNKIELNWTERTYLKNSPLKKPQDSRGLSYVVLGELYLDGFGVSSSIFLFIEQLLGVAHPGQQLIQCMLELPQCEKASLQFVLD